MATRPSWAKLILEIFRAYIVDGNPGSGAQKPVKADIRAWGATTEAAIIDLYDKAPSYLGNVGGTANVVTADATPALDAYRTGQSFWITPALTNTVATVTLALNGLTAKAWTDAFGNPIGIGRLVLNRKQLVYYDGTKFLTPTLMPLHRGHLVGMVPFNDAGTPLTKIDVSAGLCRSSDDTVDIVHSASFVKNLAATWVAGTGNGGLDTGALAASTSYDIYAIAFPDGSVSDYIICKTSLGFTFPTGYTVKRLVGQFMTSAASQVVPGVWYPDGRFLLTVPFNDVSATNPGTAAVLRTLSAPIGSVARFVATIFNATTAAIQVLITETAQTDTVPSTTLHSMRVGAVSAAQSVELERRIDAAGQVRSRLSASGAADVLNITTFGWWTDRTVNT